MDDLERARELRTTSEEAPDEVDVGEILDLVRASGREIREAALDALKELSRSDGQRLAGWVDELATFIEDDELQDELPLILVGVSLAAPLVVTESLVPYLTDEEFRNQAVTVLGDTPGMPVPGAVLPHRDALLEVAGTEPARGAALAVLAALAADYPEVVAEAVPVASEALADDDEADEAPLRLLRNVAKAEPAAVRPAGSKLRRHLQTSGYPPNPMLLETLYHLGQAYPAAVEPVVDRLEVLAEPVCPEERQPIHHAIPARARNVLATLEGGP